MWRITVLLAICFSFVYGAENSVCPDVQGMEFNLKELDGEWYIAAVTLEESLTAECAKISFNHTGNNVTSDVIIQLVTKNKPSYRNETWEFGTDSNSTIGAEGNSSVYVFLDVDYGNYAVLFSCQDIENGTSSYQLWQLSRESHLKDTAVKKIEEALAPYENYLNKNNSISFKNDDVCCKTNGGTYLGPTTLLTSTIVFTFLKNMF